MNQSRLRIAVDGGGTGTRVRMLDDASALPIESDSGPSALSQGIQQAWMNISAAIKSVTALADRSEQELTSIELAIGVSGAEIPAWRTEFLRSNPGFAKVLLATDGTTSLLGAHGGEPGVMIACGTGVIGEVLDNNRTRHTASGWGFPFGDEGGGSWIGTRAVALAMRAIDRRATDTPLSQAIQARCGMDRFTLIDWTFAAGQAGFASLAPLVFEHAPHDAAAARILEDAASELERVALALDPAATLPIAILGSIGQRIAPRMPSYTSGRHCAPRGTSLDGACLLFDHLAETWS